MANELSEIPCYWCQQNHTLVECPQLTPLNELETIEKQIRATVLEKEEQEKGLMAITLMVNAHTERYRREREKNAPKRRRSTKGTTNGDAIVIDSDSDPSKKRHKANRQDDDDVQGCIICGSAKLHIAARCPVVLAGAESIEE